jgi:branched-chain amino acid aminotransferase
MSFDGSKWVWMNGKMIPWESANVHVSAHALHYGSGVFEGIRSYETERGPAVFRLDLHLARLQTSAAAHAMEIRYSYDELADGVCDLITANEFTACYIRPICFYGSGSLNVDPSKCPLEVVMLAWPWAAYLCAEGKEAGIRVTVSPWIKFQSKMMPSTAKASGQYINSILAVHDAVQRGYDEAILLDNQGNLAEGSAENIFLVHDGKIRTNDLRHSILLGVTRDSVMTLARDLGYSVEVAELQLEDLLSADEAFLVGTAVEVIPVREVDNIKIGSGKRGPITTRIQQAYFAATTGRDSRYDNWLHYVRQNPLKASDKVSADLVLAT